MLYRFPIILLWCLLLAVKGQDPSRDDGRNSSRDDEVLGISRDVFLVSLDPLAGGTKLRYHPYENANGPNNNVISGGATNTVPDFSNAGYMGT